MLDGRRRVHFHTHRHDDVLTALRLGREFGFTPVLHHVSEGWRVADEIAAAGAPASIIVLDSPGGKLEARGLVFGTGPALRRQASTWPTTPTTASRTAASFSARPRSACAPA